MAWMLHRGMLLLALAAGAAGADDYAASIGRWRAGREAGLKSDTGWLTVAGLSWLKEGPQTVGSGPANRIVLPGGPAKLGVIEHRSGRTTLRYADGRTVKLKPDDGGPPEVVNLGAVSFWVIRRGDRYGIRVRDLNSGLRKKFTGCRWYPVKPEYRIEGRFVPHPAPRSFRVPSALGPPQEMPSPGIVELTVRGTVVRLLAAEAGEELWIIFRDGTSGKTTYGAGRFLYTEAPKNGRVTVDFNKAYNPPCAFTPYATCPLPPRENRVGAAIEAGELSYGEH